MKTNGSAGPKERIFSPYQAFVVAILAILQFTIILDFMVLSPLGAMLLKELSIRPSQFGAVVSAYAFSAGISGLLAAGFADKFDRKKMLLFFYAGFLIGTFLCAIAPTYEMLLMARIVTGIFGGVIGSISMAIITDLFKMEVRGRVMGFVQMAFAASQILGLPIGLVLANRWGWHAPFWLILACSFVVGVVILLYLKPVNAHLALKNERSAFQHLIKTATRGSYLRGFLAMMLLATGGFMMMPFGSAFAVNNMGLTMGDLPILYGVSGVFSIIFGPLSGKLSDRFGKYRIFVYGSVISSVMVLILTNLGITPLWEAVMIQVIMFAGITARMISSSALMSAIPDAKDRGAFMSINASMQQISGGVAAAVAGLIVSTTPEGKLEHYSIVGLVVIGSIAITVIMLHRINKYVAHKLAVVDKEKLPEMMVAEA